MAREIQRDDKPGKSSSYGTLVGLVKHIDIQIARHQTFHITAIGALIPLAAFLISKGYNWPYLFAIGLLALALVVQWATITTHLSLQKLCWTKALRELEPQLFTPDEGAFCQQKSFFDELPKQEVGLFDRLLVQRVGIRKFRLVPVAVLCVALLVITIFAFESILTSYQ